MTILERIDADLKEAMKAKNEPVVSALRLARSSMKNKQIDLGHELTDEEVASVLRTLLKQYRDALADFTAAARTDLMQKQASEIELLERYVPAAMSESDIETICQKVIQDTNSTVKDFGKVMGLVMKEVAGRADGNAVRAVVQKMLK